MRKSILLLGIAGLAVASAGAQRIAAPVADFNPWSLDRNSRIENPLCPQMPAERNNPMSNSFFAKKKNVPFKAAEGDGEYFVAAQRYFEGYTFVYSGGDISTYQMSIEVDGETVTIHGLMNLEAQSSEWSVYEDYDVVGTYDKEAKTVTIPTKPTFQDGTLVGTGMSGYYQEVLIAGTVAENGDIESVDELVFDVIGDFEALTATISFGIMNFSSDGVMYGFGDFYRGFYATLPQEEPKLITFSDKVDMGEQYAGVQQEGAFTLVNVSSADVNYFAEVDSEGVFSLTNEIGTISPLSAYELNMVFAPEHPGSYTANLTVEYEGEAETPEPLTATIVGTAVEMPDFNKIVKNGDFRFQTNIDYPFVLETLSNGTEVAISTCGGKGYVSSKLRVEFEVPENNLATLSWKGDISIDQLYNGVAGYFLDDSDYPAATYMESNEFSGSLEFGPGKHSILYQYDNYRLLDNPDYFMYVYDLSLDMREAVDEAVVVDNPDITLPNMLIKDDSGVIATGVVEVRNMGKTPISISSVTLSDSDNFSVDVPNGVATLYEVLPVNVNFSAKEPGQYSTKVDIITNCGNLSVEIKVLVRKMADFSSVIAEGIQYVTFIETSETDPFDVVDGVAFNANTGMDDFEPTTSWFEINFEIPDGEHAYITWIGEILSSELNPNDPLNGMDYGIIDVYNSNLGWCSVYTNEYGSDFSSPLFAELGPVFEERLEFVGPAYGSVRFSYFKNGDGLNENEDVMRISDFCIEGSGSGVDSVADKATFVSTEIFDVNGMRLARTQKGVNILRTTYSDGSVKTTKIIVK